MTIEAVNPATGESLSRHDEFSSDEAARLVDAADEAFHAWRRTSFEHRAERMRSAAELLRERSDEYAELMAREMGKPIAGGRAEVEKCAWVCEYYAEHAAGFLAEEPVETDAAESFVTFQPLGVVLAVMPWNFPFWQVFRFVAPALMAGNAGLLKHSSNVPGCALAIETVLHDAGFPTSLFRTLLIGSGQVADLLEHPKLRAATLTGSGPAGQAVAAKAGSLIKKTVLELGGSDPYVVLADADLGAAVETCVTSRLINSGQSCIAAKRFVVDDAVYDEFVERFVERMAKATMGDPLDEATDVGPQARTELRDELHEQVERSVDAGARLLLGGTIPDGPGAFYPPTVLADVAPGMAAADEELFGPVAAILRAKDEDDAIRLANETPFGLGAAVFTRDLERGRRLAAEELEAGCCFVNSFVQSDPRLPFGGIKESGYGRELSRYGIREFVNIKTVSIG
ncbi:MAG: NAD-dependent succinate-semialdehyde dehydrogenase [Acidobacteriota bacterium]